VSDVRRGFPATLTAFPARRGFAVAVRDTTGRQASRRRPCLLASGAVQSTARKAAPLLSGQRVGGALLSQFARRYRPFVTRRPSRMATLLSKLPSPREG